MFSLSAQLNVVSRFLITPVTMFSLEGEINVVSIIFDAGSSTTTFGIQLGRLRKQASALGGPRD